MKFNNSLAFIFIFLIRFFSQAQNHYSRLNEIDIQHYSFEIHLNDTTDRIEARSLVYVEFIKPSDKLFLDLIAENDSTGKGMLVSQVTEEGREIMFYQHHEQLEIVIPENIKKAKKAIFMIEYSGVPADGLIISNNKFGDRTFFGDNWPNRARFWLPTVDHPSDKATVDFSVWAPDHYQVVANGMQKEEINLENGLKFTSWHESVPISTKLMVIGVSRFAVNYKEQGIGIPISTWVFPQNKEMAYDSYSFSAKSLRFFDELIDTYPYEKLAHVQSKTRYGGMENASCIFYAEQTVSPDRNNERLFAHETAHQWFGNSVTEENWHHVWLSEGFATYLTHVYSQRFLGEETFKNGLLNDRKQIINYARKNFTPIIDTTITNYNFLLSTNSYQKASWFLHMLRIKLGDKLFFEGLRKYFQSFKNSTVLTEDFKMVMENIGKQELDLFFYQWLWQPGHPVLKFEIKQKNKRKTEIIIEQMQKGQLFEFPLELEIQYQNGQTELKTLKFDKHTSSLKTAAKKGIKDIVLDPDVKLLFEKFEP